MASVKKTKFTKVNSSGDIEEFPVIKEKVYREKFGLPKNYYDLGMYLVAPLLLGVIVGQILDRKFNTKSIFTISLIIFGTITVFHNLYKLYSEDDSNKHRNS